MHRDVVCLALAAATVLAALSPATADGGRIFSGQRKLTSWSGNQSVCIMTPGHDVLNVRVVGNEISSMDGSCKATIGADGTFRARCVTQRGVIAVPEGKMAGDTVTIHTTYTGRTATCVYDTTLHQVK